MPPIPGTLPPVAMLLLADVRILALESNHDVPMLRTGSYPRYLQDRIISERGTYPTRKPPRRYRS